VGAEVTAPAESTDLPSELGSRPFRSKYSGGLCAICENLIRVGDWIRFDGDGLLNHSRCERVDYGEIGDTGIDFETPEERDPAPTVRGRRDHSHHCAVCGLRHAGEC
jgi:hypothetical protein